MAEDVKLYNVNEGVHGRPPGIYLDDEEGRLAEVQRARQEGREPDFDNLQPHPGVQLVTAEQLVQGYNNTLISGDETKRFDGEISAPVAAEVSRVDLPEDEDDVSQDGAPEESSDGLRPAEPFPPLGN